MRNCLQKYRNQNKEKVRIPQLRYHWKVHTNIVNTQPIIQSVTTLSLKSKLVP